MDRIPCPSPWPIKYARRAKLRSDGLTLVIHQNGGIVQGQLLVLDLQLSTLDEWIEWLWEREALRASCSSQWNVPARPSAVL